MSKSLDGESEKYVGQRGPDKQQREFNPKSLYNLKQYQIPDIPVKIKLELYFDCCFDCCFYCYFMRDYHQKIIL